MGKSRQAIRALDESDLRSLPSCKELRKSAIGLFSKNL
jgi:hypothetical protein